MPDQTEISPPPSDIEIAIGHADRLWRSECENAARVERQRQLISGAILALLGLGIIQFNWTHDPDHEQVMSIWPATVVYLLALFAMICFMRSLALLYLRPAVRRGTASQIMEFDADDVAHPVGSVVFRRTYRAYQDLNFRNREMWRRIKQGRYVFVAGVIAMFSAILIYMIASAPYKLGL